MIRPGDVIVVEADWPAIISDIMLALHLEHLSQVADLICVPRSTFARWPNGSEPYWSHGAALMELHRRVCGDEKTQLRLTEFRERAIKQLS